MKNKKLYRKDNIIAKILKTNPIKKRNCIIIRIKISLKEKFKVFEKKYPILMLFRKCCV